MPNCSMRPLRGSGFVAIHSHPPIATRGECGFSGCNPLVISDLSYLQDVVAVFYLQE